MMYHDVLEGVVMTSCSLMHEGGGPHCAELQVSNGLHDIIPMIQFIYLEICQPAFLKKSRVFLNILTMMILC